MQLKRLWQKALCMMHEHILLYQLQFDVLLLWVCQGSRTMDSAVTHALHVVCLGCIWWQHMLSVQHDDDAGVLRLSEA